MGTVDVPIQEGSKLFTIGRFDSIYPELSSLLVRLEGLRLFAYYDSVGVRTIGVGHAYYVGSSPISRPYALKLLRADVIPFYLKWSSYPYVLTDNMVIGLTSFSFNLGLSGTPSVDRCFMYYDFTFSRNLERLSVCKALMKRYSYAGGRFLQGLYNRRLLEVSYLY